MKILERGSTVSEMLKNITFIIDSIVFHFSPYLILSDVILVLFTSDKVELRDILIV